MSFVDSYRNQLQRRSKMAKNACIGSCTRVGLTTSQNIILADSGVVHAT